MVRNWVGTAVLGAVLACGLPAAAQEELKIGAIGSLSGGGTAWGLALQRGAQLAVDEVVAAGGLKVGSHSYTPKLVMVDDQYTATGGHTAAQRLVTLEKVQFIIGPIGSPPVLGALSVTAPAHAVLISNGYAQAILKNADHAAYNFRAMDSNIEFGEPMIKWLRQTHPELKKVALIAPNDATGQAVLPALTEVYKANGFEVWSDMFDRGSQEFTPLLTRMLAQGVDVMDLNSNSPGDAGLLLKQARQAGFKGLMWQVGGPSVQEIVAVAGPLAEGFVSLDVADLTTGAGRKFADAYHAKWSGIINAEAPVWYNATKLMFEALRRAGSLEADKVRDAVQGLDGFDAGIYGPVKWGGQDDYGVRHQLQLPFWIVDVKGGEVHPLVRIVPDRK